MRALRRSTHTRGRGVAARAGELGSAERHDSDTVRGVGRLDHASLANVDRHVMNVCPAAVEEQVSGKEVREGDARAVPELGSASRGTVTPVAWKRSQTSPEQSKPQADTPPQR